MFQVLLHTSTLWKQKILKEKKKAKHPYEMEAFFKLNHLWNADTNAHLYWSIGS